MKTIVRFLFRLLGTFLLTPAIIHAQWVQTNGPHGGETTALFAKGDTILAGVNGGFQFSTDNGDHWIQSDTIHAYVYSLESDGINVFAATGMGVSRSPNYGMSWTPASQGLTSGVGSFAFLGAKIFAATDHGVFVSSDGGTHWSRSDTIRTGVPASGVSAIAVCDTNIIISCYLASTVEYSIWGITRSSDEGKSWSSPDITLNDDLVTILATQNNNIFAAVLKGGILRSSHSSRLWVWADTGLSDIHVISLKVSGTNIFAGTWSGVYLSTNSGAEWKQISSGLGSTAVMSLAVNGKYLFAGTESTGIWRRPLSELTSANNISPKTPNGFALEQNYPNPFNPTTIIRYALPVATLVTLKVYDILGRNIKTLVSQRQGEGVHSVPLHAGDLPSGIYFYRLTAQNFVSIKKLVIIK